MPILFPQVREMHVARIFGTNKQGDLLSDIWVDMLRLDRIVLRTQTQQHIPRPFGSIYTPPEFSNSQDLVIQLKWADDPLSRSYDPDLDTNITREYEILKVCSPQTENFEDPDEWVPVPVITRFRLRGGQSGDVYRQWLNKVVDSKRIVSNRRIVNYATNIDDMAQKAADDDGQKTYCVPIDPDDLQYVIDEESKNVDNYVEHEVATMLGGRGSTDWQYTTGGDQEIVWVIKNQFLIDFSDEAKLEEHGTDNYNPPYRMDPFQNIINVNLGGLAVEFGDHDLDAPVASEEAP
jgi:hypothetical protein